MTVRRMGTGMVDDERSCVACDQPAPAEPFQVELPQRKARLFREAEQLEGRAKALRAEAATVAQQIKAAVAPSYLCRNCRTHLHDDELSQAWPGGRHRADDAELIDRTVAYIESHRPGARGSCVACTPGAIPERQPA